MKLLIIRVFFLILLSATLLLFLARKDAYGLTLIATSSLSDTNDDDLDERRHPVIEYLATTYSRRGLGDAYPPLSLTSDDKCDENPRICRKKGSRGPDCCDEKCVNVMTDRKNCGRCDRECEGKRICCKGKCVDRDDDSDVCGECGRKCKGDRTCCQGKCVNLLFDPNNCGMCSRRCRYYMTCCKGICQPYWAYCGHV